MKWKLWLYTLATAAVKAAADGFLLSIVAPEISLVAIGKAVGIGALTSIAHILRESPLPRVEWDEAKREAEIAKLEDKIEVIHDKQIDKAEEKIEEIKNLPPVAKANGKDKEAI